MSPKLNPRFNVTPCLSPDVVLLVVLSVLTSGSQTHTFLFQQAPAVEDVGAHVCRLKTGY